MPQRGHRWPVTIKTDNVLQSTDPNLPVSESINLSPRVPPALIQDVEDSEEAHFAGVYRASVVICRCALQLSFQEEPFNGDYILHAGPPTSWVNSLASTLLQVYNPPFNILLRAVYR
jgi:hypothetical protein